MRTRLTRPQARRVALSAQGVGGTPPAAVTARQLNRELSRMATLQIDSVNVFARSHYMPLFSRLGAYDTGRLDRLLFQHPAPYVEFWAHQAAFIPATDWNLFGFRMAEHRARHERTGWFAVDDETLQWVRTELRDRGPMRPAQIEHDAERATRGPWWDWSAVKSSLEYLWFTGEVAIAGRRGFERVYGLAEDVIPADTLSRPVPREEALPILIERAARACGVATIADLDDYWRIRDQRTVATVVRALEAQGILHPVQVDGWRQPAWLHHAASVPRSLDGATVLTPFDPVVWFRPRAERLFDFDYRIEIYTPAPQRRFGYYSLPVVIGDRVVGRVDLKADRAASVLRVQAAWWEPEPPLGAAERLADVLREAARWQGLAGLSVSRWGNAAEDVARALPEASRHVAGPEPVALAGDEPG
ncbi:MAG: winged helix DNA-binding domain-containing protein [Microbacterium sp.]|uniref:winged helix-turn-helix domain-containing protein n=1 Tax=Microbacterium sp. TaxID=51671 RepID=UPI002619612C|nr:crosslink repair DNA glycosylase YcaQ family protein [Microbacterium sp.]MCX6502159.1 winged helix DNA-binding domain-containing protein [Microbacterium sp.]